jgi:hypothetical protein
LKSTVTHLISTQLQFLTCLRLLSQVIPTDGNASPDIHYHGSGKPEFSLATMSTNFRRFNTRIGVVFAFQNKVAKILSWRKPSHTLSLLFVYSFLCLDPSLFPVLPLAIAVLGVFIPSFIARHPAPPLELSASGFEYSPAGPAIAPPPTVKPVKELSKDFFRNMRDLQNSMSDFSDLHDAVVGNVGPLTNFSDEALSSTLFLGTFMATAAMFIASHLIPYRAIFLLGGWFVIISGHPRVAHFLANLQKEKAPDAVEKAEKDASSFLKSFIDSDVILDPTPQTREVEIFELQRLSGAGEWEPWLFSASPYDPLSQERIREERPQGTRFFEDVAPPRGWEWEEKKWSLDLWSREWVEERIITGVEVETQGERWVYDIAYEEEKNKPREVEVRDNKGGLAGQKGKKVVVQPTWDETAGGLGRKGEWRRRRWVRLVRRKVVKETDA